LRLTGAELVEQVGQWSVWQATGDVVEDSRRHGADLLWTSGVDARICR
jgi:hypothetical protein